MSSIYKTPIRLTNSTGIIDSAYNGNLMGAIDNIHSPKRVWQTFTDLYARPFPV